MGWALEKYRQKDSGQAGNSPRIGSVGGRFLPSHSELPADPGQWTERAQGPRYNNKDRNS